MSSINTETTKNYLSNYSKESVDNRRFYNVGAGNFYHPCWTNLDYGNDWYLKYKERIDQALQYDLLSMEPLPLETDKAEVFYTSHTIEHIPNEAVVQLFTEMHRCLKKGGIVRITAPDIDLVHRAWQEEDLDFFYWIEMNSQEEVWKRRKLNGPMNKASLEQIFLHLVASSRSQLHIDGTEERMNDEEFIRLFKELPYAEALDAIVKDCPIEIQRKYPGNHMNWWNHKKVMDLLSSVGFSKVYRSGYGQSHSPAMRDTDLFDNTHPKISFYVEAQK
ncbi:MAG: methyltransferase domain-containing protein [Crocinitomicaceae bacterium]